MAQSEERWYASHDAFASSLSSIGFTHPQSPTYPGTSIYNMAISGSATSTTYTIQATPVSTGLNKTDGLLQIKQDGSKCWDKDNRGSCSTSEHTWPQYHPATQ